MAITVTGLCPRGGKDGVTGAIISGSRAEDVATMDVKGQE